MPRLRRSRLVAVFGLARHQHFGKAFGQRRRLHAVDQRVDAGAVVVLGDEQVGLHRQEEVADVLRRGRRLVLVADLAAEIGARDHAAENVHEHRDAGALVLADRQHHAAGERGLGVGGRAALGVERIAQRDAFAAALGLADFAARRDRGRHVEDDRPVLAGRRRHAERIGAEQHLLEPHGGIACEALENTIAISPASTAGMRVGRRHAEMRASAAPTRRRCRTRAPWRWPRPSRACRSRSRSRSRRRAWRRPASRASASSLGCGLISPLRTRSR